MLRSVLESVRVGYAAARRWFETVFYDRPAGIETSNVVKLDTFGLAAKGRQNYHATPWPLLQRALSEREWGASDVFIDFGCGKGRVLLEAAARGFRRVIGVELSPALADIARTNIESARARLRCKDVTVITADVLNYDVPDDVTVVYFFDPFHGEIFSAVVDKLVASVRRRPRQLTILYMDPEEEPTLLAAGARCVKSFGGMRPSRKWAQENSLRMYNLDG